MEIQLGGQRKGQFKDRRREGDIPLQLIRVELTTRSQKYVRTHPTRSSLRAIISDTKETIHKAAHLAHHNYRQFNSYDNKLTILLHTGWRPTVTYDTEIYPNQEGHLLWRGLERRRGFEAGEEQTRMQECILAEAHPLSITERVMGAATRTCATGHLDRWGCRLGVKLTERPRCLEGINFLLSLSKLQNNT